MWQAKLIAVIYDLNKTVDAIKMTVELFHTDGRSTTKTYILYLDEMSDTTLATIKAQVVSDLARLEKLDVVKNALTSKIGMVI